ncbi:MAG: thioredoxin domain-containing protein, partial [Pseudomonadales bacterium]|nr:thioredoxin domain-containing protein [Pseudomonadales bacterium]
FYLYAEALLEGREPPGTEQETAELPFWASAEGLAPDPERPGFTLAGDAWKGNPKAELVVIEFVDFQCPPCREHALESQPVIDEALVDEGKLLWIVKHYPLRSHTYAVLAAVTAECAGDQGKFWAMHDRLFERVEQWASEEAESALVSLAAELELDMPAFEACFNGRQAMQYVLDDLYDARGVVRRTPTFIVLKDGKANAARPMPGEQFVTLLSKRLAD